MNNGVKKSVILLLMCYIAAFAVLSAAETFAAANYNMTESRTDLVRQTNEILIGSAEQWLTFASSCNDTADYSIGKSIYLTSDIDFGGVEFIPIKIFHGKFFGGYHTLKNITLTEKNKVFGVFGTVTVGATIERLSVENLMIDCKNADYVGFIGENYGTVRSITIGGKITGRRYVGGIVGYNGRTSKPGTFPSEYENAAVSDSVNNASIFGAANTGGICGYNIGDISQSQNSGVITGSAVSPNETVLIAGGIAGYSAGRITGCENNGNIASDNSFLYAGGIAGICTGEIYFSFNRANVSAIRYVGGACGYYGALQENQDDLSDFFGGSDFQAFLEKYFGNDLPDVEESEGALQIFSYVYNEGNVKASSYAGGILGYTQSALPVKNCVSIGDVSAAAGNYAGGIIGYTDKATVSGCLSAGKISAKATSGGNYVGGICGYGFSVMYSTSSAQLFGNDYIGGISGMQTDNLESCYTNVLIKANSDSKFLGAIAGFSSSFNPSLGNFGGKIKYNYYIGNCGGISETDFGESSDFAAMRMESIKLKSQTVLSTHLPTEFNSEYWTGGVDSPSYPVPYYLLHAQGTEIYGDKEMFEALFLRYSSDFTQAATHFTKSAFQISFMEWNKDLGDLYIDGEYQTDSFESIGVVRLYEGDIISQLPEFKFAERQSDGSYIMKSSEAWYFVHYVLPEGELGENIFLYPEYRKIATTLTDEKQTVLIEGIFDSDTQMTVEETDLGIRLRFFLHGEEIHVENVKIKYYIGENIKDYEVFYSDAGTLIRAETTVSGNYLCFNYSDGQLFVLKTLENEPMPFWAWLLIGVCGGTAITSLSFITVFLIKKRKKLKRISNSHK